jgi:hypothetical protein
MTLSQAHAVIQSYDPDVLVNSVNGRQNQRYRDEGKEPAFFDGWASVTEIVSRAFSTQNIPNDQRQRWLWLARTMYSDISGTESNDGEHRLYDYATFFARPIVVSRVPTPVIITNFTYHGAELRPGYKVIVRNPNDPQRFVERPAGIAGNFLPEYGRATRGAEVNLDGVNVIPYRTLATKIWSSDIQFLHGLSEPPTEAVLFLPAKIESSPNMMTQEEKELVCNTLNPPQVAAAHPASRRHPHPTHRQAPHRRH